MYFADTEMTMVVFIITVTEIIFLFALSLYYNGRPKEIRDKKTRYFLILSILMIMYNLTSGLFPDPDIKILSVTTQNILAYSFAVIMTLYFAFFLYKFYDLKQLRFFALFGGIFFVIAPALIISILYSIGVLTMVSYRQMFVIAPICYGIGWFVFLTKAVIKKYRKTPEKDQEPSYKLRIISVYMAFCFWAALPVIVFFGDFQILEHSTTNAGFLVMTIAYYVFSVKRHESEYKTYLEISEIAERKSKEITKAAHRISQTTDILEKIDFELKKLDVEKRQQLGPIANTIKTELETGRKTYYEIFDHSFDLTQNGFFEKLNKLYPGKLSNTDMKLLSYFKLNMSNKEIANLMHIKPDSVRQARFRIKKKLALKGDNWMEELLNKIDLA